MQPLSSYTLADPKVMQNPYPYYERLRAKDPVAVPPDQLDMSSTMVILRTLTSLPVRLRAACIGGEITAHF
jgi:hypothetical protein